MAGPALRPPRPWAARALWAWAVLLVAAVAAFGAIAEPDGRSVGTASLDGCALGGVALRLVQRRRRCCRSVGAVALGHTFDGVSNHGGQGVGLLGGGLDR